MNLRTFFMITAMASLAAVGCTTAPEPPGEGSSPSGHSPGPPVVESLPGIGSGSLRGMAVRGADTVWVSGTEGTVRRSSDGGQTWEDVAPKVAKLMDFRDIQLLEGEGALIMSVGHGQLSRVYRTLDGGANWTVVLNNQDPLAFFNSIAFWDSNRGLLVSDSRDGQAIIMRTLDAGATWKRVGQASLPPLIGDEAGFAASGTVVATVGDNRAWVATGGAAARVFRTEDGGETWTVSETPFEGGVTSRGIFSVAFRDARHGVIVGGDYLKPEIDFGNAAWSEDGGRTWQRSEPPPGPGLPHRSCVQHLGAGRYLAAGRTGGLAFSEDDGRSWWLIPSEPYYTIGYDAESGVGYLAGSGGRVGRFTTSGDPS